jgi:hypothetical protein
LSALKLEKRKRKKLNSISIPLYCRILIDAVMHGIEKSLAKYAALN